MIKIKEDVNLKELEKFGFEYDDGEVREYYHGYPSYSKCWNMKDRYGVYEVNIIIETREIQIFEIPDDDVRFCGDKKHIKDLIEADLVEVVNDSKRK